MVGSPPREWGPYWKNRYASKSIGSDDRISSKHKVSVFQSRTCHNKLASEISNFPLSDDMHERGFLITCDGIMDDGLSVGIFSSQPR